MSYKEFPQQFYANYHQTLAIQMEGFFHGLEKIRLQNI